MAHQYFTDTSLENKQVVTVTGDEASHAVIVSRLRNGERLRIGDGRGTVAVCEAKNVTKKYFEATIIELIHEESPNIKLNLVIALLKGARDEAAVEQATEFGIDVIIPWQAERSVSKWDTQKSEKNQTKWQKIAREASKQSLRSWIPEVKKLQRSLDFLLEVPTDESLIVFLDPRANQSLKNILDEGLKTLPALTNIYFVVGPEGGITENELAVAESLNAGTANLGQNILRGSSAPIAALAIANVALGRW